MAESDALRILQLSTSDLGGGAESVALRLHRTYRSRGLDAWLAVGKQRSHEPGVLPIPNDESRGPWARAWLALSSRSGAPEESGRHLGVASAIAEPDRFLARKLGREDFAFPGSWRVLDLPPEQPTILHGHNLHGGYFDLRALPRLSSSVPVILTLHDAWLLSGHCAHSLGCERWETGCGKCPDLTLPPAVSRDATAFNWRRKRDLFTKSQLFVATPSQWLMDKTKRSIVARGVLESRVIPNGVDLDVFHPGDRGAARSELNIPADASVLLFAAHATRENPWKDFATMRSALAELAALSTGRHIIFLALGEEQPDEVVGTAELRYLPHQPDPAVVATYYRAADIYVHAARADTFPTSIIEALACGTPVVATAVGGIPEQIHDSVTGFLVPPGYPRGMADAIVTLLRDEQLRSSMAAAAGEDARNRFDQNRQADAYLDWYRQICGSVNEVVPG